jgi:hypothetical protein
MPELPPVTNATAFFRFIPQSLSQHLANATEVIA